MQYPSNHDAHLNGELLDTLCEKRHNAVVVMDNKYYFTLEGAHHGHCTHLQIFAST